MVHASLRLSHLGSGAVLLDMADGTFSGDVQKRVWSLAASASRLEGVGETVPGMNNLLVTFDATVVVVPDLERALRVLWSQARPEAVDGKTVEVPVTYGGQGGEDLLAWARHCGLPVAEAVRRHAASTYGVAAVGAMPGFPYLSGLDPALAQPRRASPRAVVRRGAVMIGGVQAGIMPQTAPSGWHILGHTDIVLFDPTRSPPTLLQPGDTLRFTVVDIEP